MGRDGYGMEDVRELLDDNRLTLANYYFDLLVIGLIILSCLIYVALTYASGTTYLVLFGVEIVLMAFFTLEFSLRIYLEKKYKKYLFSWYGLFDALAVIPFWLAFAVPGMGSLLFLRILRIFKLYRFFNKYLDEAKAQKRIASRILITKMVFTLGAILFISSGLFYTFEGPVNDKINYFDDALYFSLVTITTVGFGDITPVSKAGRFVVMGVVLLSIFLIPVYLASLLRAYMSQNDKKATTCKKCGLRYHDANAVHCKMCGEIIYQEFDDPHS